MKRRELLSLGVRRHHTRKANERVYSNSATNWLRRHPLFCFFTLAFLLTWANWIPRALLSHGLIEATVPGFLAPLAGYGPALAAIIVTGVVSGRSGLRRLGERVCRWRVGTRWYAVALFLPAAQAFASLGLHLLFGGELHKPGEVPTLQVGPPDGALLLKVLLLILMFTLGFDGLGEELGWRGFALPRLLAQYPALGASVALAAIWALWHLPYALTKGSAMDSGTCGRLRAKGMTTSRERPGRRSSFPA